MSEDLDIRRTYTEHRPVLEKIANELEQSIRAIFQSYPRLDSVRSRVKTVESFVEKAQKQENGGPKYLNPFDDIYDQIGCRIVVFFRSDLKDAEKLVLEEFHRIEVDRKQPEKPSIFEYEATHLICYIPREIGCRLNSPIDFFEVQIKTLFQHACAQAYHDIGYKSRLGVDFDDDRLMHFAFASAWGADEIFDQMWRKHRN